MSALVANVGFAPIATPATRLLILGSLPGVESLRRGEYYASRFNAFWRVMGALVGASPDLPYEQRRRRLEEAGIALWDVCHSAKRPGSLDGSIDHRSVEPNDFAEFFKGKLMVFLRKITLRVNFWELSEMFWVSTNGSSKSIVKANFVKVRLKLNVLIY